MIVADDDGFSGGSNGLGLLEHEQRINKMSLVMGILYQTPLSGIDEIGNTTLKSPLKL
ncbi:MAG: hypothetical protein VKL59_22275 [Nostocaceae cyanobacterium]|nr:hypothetical protein [Nostocaceae cyanobacterium]